MLIFLKKTIVVKIKGHATLTSNGEIFTDNSRIKYLDDVIKADS